jgi:hypothetical protein
MEMRVAGTLNDDVEAAAINDDRFAKAKAGKTTQTSPRGSGLTENDEVKRGSSTPSLRHSSMLHILVKVILLSVPHIDLPSAQSPPLSRWHVLPNRSQSQVYHQSKCLRRYHTRGCY